MKSRRGANSEERVIRFENVGLRYGLGPEVLRDVTFHIAPGSFQFVTGPSGAGKTSLLRLLFLSLKPTRGADHLFDQDVATCRRTRSRRCAGASASCSRISACSTT